ncbi:MAG: Melittin resistance protein PqaB [Acidobacteriaceae bacterium]|nr:Melittin resistance protein PqaB [Acidobacteriaceae bacterium]
MPILSNSRRSLSTGLNLNHRTRSIADYVLLAGFCGFLFFFGLGHFGLVGADEPRYAQVAREMLARHDWITPTLGGKPWLEKPVLYYWQAMLSYNLFGVSDWAARIPSAFDATLMVFGVYFFLRRLGSKTEYAGFPLDGALFTASAAGVIGFARAASTDMPLAAMFTLGMLTWYAWRESGTKSYLALFYVFIGLATLAKGPVAPFLAAAIIVVFAIATHDLRIVGRTLWLSGILLFCIVTLPWYIAVQMRNSEFFRVFILEHNLARFGSNLYHHTQPFWYYLPVASFGLIPWIIFVVAAFVESSRQWWESRGRTTTSENALNIFLVIWLVLPILFFSISKSKLPGYILPALPAATFLLGDYVRRTVASGKPSRNLPIVFHSIVSALPVIPALMIQYLVVQHRLPWSRALVVSCVVAFALAIAIGTMLKAYGLRMLRTATLIPVVLAVAFVVRFGSPAIDRSLSARPLANDLSHVENHFKRPMPVAILRLSREDEYGLQFYFDSPIPRYELGEIPAEEHIVVVPRDLQDGVIKRAAGRQVVHLGTFAPRALEYFWVASQ